MSNPASLKKWNNDPQDDEKMFPVLFHLHFYINT